MPSSHTSDSTKTSDPKNHYPNDGLKKPPVADDAIHLVGSPRLEVCDILENAGLSPSDDRQHLSMAPTLRAIARQYEKHTHENIRLFSRLQPIPITGAEIVESIVQQVGSPGLRGHPIVNLAPLTVQILYQATAVQKQIMRIYNDGATVVWGAPQFSPNIHRAIFHWFSDIVKDNRAGFIGDERKGYLNQQFDKEVGELLRRGYNTALILDDRCSGETETLRHVRDRLGRGRIGTLAFVVGHAAVPKIDKNGQPYRDSATGVRVCAPVFRYQNPEEERLNAAGVADELKDLGYGAAAGHCYLRGYDRYIAETFKHTQRAINEFIATHDGITPDALQRLGEKLLVLGVQVVNSELLHQVLYQKHSSGGLPISNRDLRELFSHDPRILQVTERPDCNPNLAAVARLPMLWPGDPTQNSFHRELRKFDSNNPHLGWLRLSYYQLAATIEVVDSLKQLTGCEIPVAAFPFLSLDKVRACLPESAWNPRHKARDILSMLLRQLGNQCGMPKIFFQAGLT